jgi:GNAT superfamily N-acetyltransferase
MLSLRTASQKDIPLILSFIRELAEYEREPNAVRCTEDDVRRDGFGKDPKFRVVLAEWNGTPAGMALFFHYYSTWQGRPGIYLEDLFVRPKFREKGVGKALMIHLAGIALAENCYGLRWEVLNWNEPAMEFYQHLGSGFRENWKVMQISGEELRQLARRGKDSPKT